MKAELITIGDELLIGQVIDTNSSWMASHLNAVGVEVTRRLAVGDTKEAIKAALAEALGRVDVVLITGGLGPTNDDLTRDALAEYFSSNLVLHPEILNSIEQRFILRGIPMPSVNARMAMVPDKASIIQNDWGTAPGLLFEIGKAAVWVLPGVPAEMKGMMTASVLPALMKAAEGNTIVHRTIQTIGLAESSLAERLADWESGLPEFIRLAYLPAAGAVRLRLSAQGPNRSVLESALDLQVNMLQKLIGSNIFSFDDRTLEEVVGDRLKKANATLCTAESCTGGAISKLIVRVSGSSVYFKGSVVAYSYEAKEQILGVSMDLINKYGAVSEQCVVAMAEGARKLLNSDYAIATSGIAGPSGGTPQKPVGTVWMAVASPKKTITQCFQFGKNREFNIERSVSAALHLLLNTMDS